MELIDCLREMVARDAQDLHLTTGAPPAFRIQGELYIADELEAVTEEEMIRGLDMVLIERQRQQLLRDLELDFGFDSARLGRFRGNAAMERGRLSLVIRRVLNIDLDMDSLGLPAVCKELTAKARGLVVVTGPNGSGKSTTLASMVDYVNTRQNRRIVTLEDPIEYLFKNKRSVITQRQIGQDAHSFMAALDHVSRQNPDIIMVGEFRDAPTVAAALTASETGHLVLTTGHAPSAAQAVDRIIDLFAPEHQAQVRAQLAVVLQAVIYQMLLPRRDGKGRVLAAEVMLGTTAIRNLIREGKTHQLPSAIQLGQNQGMISFDDAVVNLFRTGVITQEVAIRVCQDRDQMERSLRSGPSPLTTVNSVEMARSLIDGDSTGNGPAIEAPRVVRS